MIFDFQIMFDNVPNILMGLGLTLELLFISGFLGLTLAVFLLFMRISGQWYLNGIAQAYIYIFRGTPILVQIFIVYYGFPQLDFIRESFLWPVFREPYGCAIVALSLNNAATGSEILRGGVLGVDRGVHEVGRALGLSASQRFIYITAPIAIRLAIPAYSNDFISLLKATALASTITMADMMGISRTIVSNTFAPYEIYIALAVIYMILTFSIQKSFGRFEKYMSKYVKK